MHATSPGPICLGFACKGNRSLFSSPTRWTVILKDGLVLAFTFHLLSIFCSRNLHVLFVRKQSVLPVCLTAHFPLWLGGPFCDSLFHRKGMCRALWEGECAEIRQLATVQTAWAGSPCTVVRFVCLFVLCRLEGPTVAPAISCH